MVRNLQLENDSFFSVFKKSGRIVLKRQHSNSQHHDAFSKTDELMLPGITKLNGIYHPP
jgi:hypothetical protein